MSSVIPRHSLEAGHSSNAGNAAERGLVSKIDVSDHGTDLYHDLFLSLLKTHDSITHPPETVSQRSLREPENLKQERRLSRVTQRVMPAATPEYDPTGLEFHTIPSLAFQSGTTLHDVQVAYRSYNRESTAGTVLIPTCFAGRINTTLSFNHEPAKSLSKYHVVVVAMLGNGESASSSNKSFFPAPGSLHYEDVVNAQYHLVTEGLKVQQLEAVVGFSMGGQQAYHWAVMYPDFVKRIVGICTSARTSPHNYAFLEGPIAALSNSIDYIAWKQIQEKVARGEDVGANLKEVRPKKGLAAWARAYAAWLTSAKWYRDEEWAKSLGCKNVEEYMEIREAGYANWGADNLLAKARMWQMADIGKTKKREVTQLGRAPGNDEDFQRALASIQAKVLLMPCRTDQYFPPEDNEYEIKYIKAANLAVIESSWGHTAGGGANPDDVAFMDSKIAEHMNK